MCSKMFFAGSLPLSCSSAPLLGVLADLPLQVRLPCKAAKTPSKGADAAGQMKTPSKEHPFVL
ncbi:unnamed protein product [Meloidogyne enterolobii]|uniref:Uncharacterized protein n=1 Tax=Meloidogyne enterolobii TaxID=390850 RepID=A0ACB0Z5A0_MELEN